MNQQEINCTLEAAKTLNFNRAAENLYLSQPTLSYHIKNLETELGFQIFNRNGRSISLTDAGKQFCQGLREIDADLKRLIEQCQNFSNCNTPTYVGKTRNKCLYNNILIFDRYASKSTQLF